MEKPFKQLKLVANDHKDLKVISSCLQDSIIYPSMMNFLGKENRFVILVNRFCWEHGEEDHEGVVMHRRVHSGVSFSHVHNVRQKGMHAKKDRHQAFSLLACHGDVDGEIHLLFSGGHALCLNIEHIKCHFKDMHDAWWTHQKPHHPLAA